MKQTKPEIEILRAKAEASLCKTAEINQVLAKLEATLLRKENQKVTEKTKKP